jgi:GNAT superfamily N-acetyltransferase
MTNFVCRAMQQSDLAAVIRIQAEAYVDEMHEADEVIHARFAQAPDTSWVVARGDGVCGYLVGYQSTLGLVSPLGFEFSHKPQADTLYLHDLALSRAAKGYGLGPLVVHYALSAARQRQLRHAALVSVQNSKVFWEKLGFTACDNLSPAQQQNLATYAGPAFYMARRLIA